MSLEIVRTLTETERLEAEIVHREVARVLAVWNALQRRHAPAGATLRPGTWDVVRPPKAEEEGGDVTG